MALMDGLNVRPWTPAEDFLINYLDADGRLARDVQTAAAARGISKPALQRAKTKLGVETTKTPGLDGPWIWRLPWRRPLTSESYVSLIEEYLGGSRLFPDLPEKRLTREECLEYAEDLRRWGCVDDPDGRWRWPDAPADGPISRHKAYQLEPFVQLVGCYFFDQAVAANNRVAAKREARRKRYLSG